MKLIELIYIYPLFYGLTVFFEARAYTARNNMRNKPAQGYNRFQKLNFLGRFGPLFGMPIIGYALDTGVSNAELALILGIANLIGMAVYMIQGPWYTRLEKKHIIWIVGTMMHAGGMHFLFILSNCYVHYRATILMMSPAVNGIGTFLIVFVIEHQIALEIDNGVANKQFLRNQFVRVITHGAVGLLFLLYAYIESLS